MRLLGFKVHAAVLLKGQRILAYSLGRTEEEAVKHLQRVKNHHLLSGAVRAVPEFERQLEDAIKLFFGYGRLPEFIGPVKAYRHPTVYRELLKIPRGRTITYGELAKRAGVFIFEAIAALKFNPWPIFWPCHRVIKKNGALGGYTPLGQEFKRRLLELERKTLPAQKVL